MAKIEIKEVMLAYADPATHHHITQWLAGLRLSHAILNYMRPDDWEKKPMPNQQVFDALVAGRCFREASELAWEHLGCDIGCSGSTEHVLSVGASIINKLADEDQAKVDKENTE